MTDCIFLSRGYPTPLPTLEELFATAVISQTNGINQDTTYDYIYYPIPSGLVGYTFTLCNGYLGIWKWTRANAGSAAIPVSTPIKKTSSSYCGITRHDADSSWQYYNGGYSESQYGSRPYGGTIAVVSFPSYEPEVIDKVLSRMTVNRRAYRNSSSTGQVRTNNKSDKFYLVAYDKYLELWSCDGSTWTFVRGTNGSTSAYAGTVSGSYLYASYSTYPYGASIIGLS